MVKEAFLNQCTTIEVITNIEFQVSKKWVRLEDVID